MQSHYRAENNQNAAGIFNQPKQFSLKQERASSTRILTSSGTTFRDIWD
jgi:hypothetical protein